MDMVAGAAIVCLAAAIAIWANDHLPFKDSDDKLFEVPSHE
jgi:hypothetical protein